MRFEFGTASRIIFGVGAVNELVPAVTSLGQRVLFVRGRSAQRASPWIERLRKHGEEVHEFAVSSEPTTETVLLGVEQARAANSDVVVGIGGGSVLDAGKAIATMLANPGTLYDYLEVIGSGKALVRPAVPFIAIPTTAGTGTEVTRNAVLGVTEQGVKVSLRGSQMLPRVAIVDPELTYSLPPSITASAGMDALTQLVEPFLSLGANPLTDAVCREGMERVRRSLRIAFESGPPQAREDMSLAAVLGGMALANAKLGAAHGFAGPVGGKFKAGHGAVCGRLLPIVAKTNLRALLERAPESPVLNRFVEVASILTDKARATAQDGVECLYELRDVLGIPTLSSYGVGARDIPDLAHKAQQSSSMKGNPIQLTEDELQGILREAL